MKIEWNLWINETTGIQIKGEGGQEPSIELLNKGEITADEHAAMFFVAEIARCLLAGRKIDTHFNPTKPLEKLLAEEKLVRCKWTKSGKLLVLVDDENKRWKHASTVGEAMSRKRVFTCTREVYDATPKRRPGDKKLTLTTKGAESCEASDGAIETD